MNLPPLILASASPRRAQLLQSAGLEFVVIPALATELEPDHLTPHECVQINAYRKARAVAKQHPDAVVLGADTEVSLDGRVFGKPATIEEAHGMLTALQGRTHEVISGVCLIHLRAHWQRLFAVSTLVAFRPLDAGQIRDYLARTQPLDKAGAYAIQEEGHLIVEALDGSFTNVVGLPMARLLEELVALGASEPAPE
jgi:septum formation protein